MKINFKQNNNTNSELFDLQESDQTSQLFHFYETIIKELNRKNISIDNKNFHNNKSYKDVSFPENDSTIDINVLFTNKKELVFEKLILDGTDDIAEGAFIMQDTAGFWGGKNEYLNSFNIIVPIEYLYFQGDINEKVLSDINDGVGENYQEHLEKYLNTITHEVIHALEFIENAGGLTPKEVEKLYEERKLDFGLLEASTGYGQLNYANDFGELSSLDFFEINEIVEERVEHKGLLLLESLNIDFESAYKYEKPISFKIENKSFSLSM